MERGTEIKFNIFSSEMRKTLKEANFPQEITEKIIDSIRGIIKSDDRVFFPEIQSILDRINWENKTFN